MDISTSKVVLNAAAALVVAGNARDLEQGVGRAQAMLDSGRAHALLVRWIAFMEGELSEDNVPAPAEDKDNIRGMGHPGRIFNSTLTHPEEGLGK